MGETRLLSPWDQMGWFETPKESVFSMTGSPVQIALRNPQRVSLLIGLAGSATTVNVSTSPAVTTASGILLSQQGAVLQLTQAWHGPLCQGEWWAVGPAATKLTVIEVVLRDWPRTDEVLYAG